MNQAHAESAYSKPGFDRAPASAKLDFSLRTETSPRAEGIYVSTAALTAQIENGARAVGGETTAQLTLKTWLAELVQNNYLPYLGADTIGALAFRAGAVDKTAHYVFTKSKWDEIWGLPGKRADGKTSVVGGNWTNNDMLIALRLPLTDTSRNNPVGLVQAGIFNLEKGLQWYEMLRRGPHTQNLTTLVNLLFGLSSFGIDGNKANLSDTAKLQLPGGFPGQHLAHADHLQILPNHYFGGEISGRPKMHNLIKIANF